MSSTTKARERRRNCRLVDGLWFLALLSACSDARLAAKPPGFGGGGGGLGVGVGTVHLKFLLDGRKSLPEAAAPGSFAAGLASALRVPRHSIVVGKAVRAGEDEKRAGGVRRWVLRARVAVQSEKVADGLAQRLNRSSFIKTLVDALFKAGFVVASSRIHAIPGAFSFTRAKGVCAMASNCKQCSAHSRCAWCRSMAKCLNSDGGSVCAGDSWDTKACAMDRASLAVDRMDDNKGDGAPSDTIQLSALVGLIAVFSTALLLIGLYQRVQHHFRTFSGVGRVIDTSAFEEIEESLELAEFDFDDEELAYSREESSSLLSLY